MIINLKKKKKGATSFKYLKTIDGKEYATFREAAVALGLINEESQWQNCIIEAINVETSVRRIRLLFALICINCQPVNPSALELWNIFHDHLISDFVKKGHSLHEAESKAIQVKLKFKKI